MSDAWLDLAALLDASGIRMTFDGRRYARAAREWPDCLPPMLGVAERWVKLPHGQWVLTPYGICAATHHQTSDDH